MHLKKKRFLGKVNNFFQCTKSFILCCFVIQFCDRVSLLRPHLFSYKACKGATNNLEKFDLCCYNLDVENQ